MFDVILKNWNFLRIIRLLLGVMLLGQSFQIHSWALGLLGGLFVFQSLTNTGCCGAGACYTPPPAKKPAATSPQEIEYEEVK